MAVTIAIVSMTDAAFAQSTNYEVASEAEMLPMY
jgi:hypothetical protein